MFVLCRVIINLVDVATPQRSVTVFVRKESLFFTVDLPDHKSSISSLVSALHSQHNVQIPEQRIVLTTRPNGEPSVISSIPVGDCKISILSQDEFDRFRKAREMADQIQKEKLAAFNEADEVRRKAERKADEMRRDADEMRRRAERKAEELMNQIGKDLRW